MDNYVESPTRRTWWVALLLGLLSPGLGHFYAGCARRGVAMVLLAVLLSCGARWIFGSSVTLGVFLTFCSMAFSSYIPFDAMDCARRAGAVQLASYQRWYCYVGLGLLSILLVSTTEIFMRREFAEPFVLRNSSMLPTIQLGETLIVDKRAYTAATPQRGDIVAFSLPGSDATLLRRVVAIGGDEIELAGQELRVNGQVIKEEYAQYLEGGTRDFPLTVVPPSTVIVMGDNRDQSEDSRFYENPFIDESWIIGRAKAILWSWRNLRRIGQLL